MNYSPISRAARLRHKSQEARTRGNEERARMLLMMHRAYVAEGLALTHKDMGSDRTAQVLIEYAAELWKEARA